MHSTTQQNPFVIAAGAGRFADLGDHRGRLLVSAESTDGAFALFTVDVDPDGGVPPHVHAREDETFHILSGRFEIVIGEQTTEIGPGDTAFAPRGLPHAWRCIGAEGGRMLVLVTPGDSFERFAFRMAEAGIVPSDPDGIAKLLALAERHGIEILPPIK